MSNDIRAFSPGNYAHIDGYASVKIGHCVQGLNLVGQLFNRADALLRLDARVNGYAANRQGESANPFAPGSQRSAQRTLKNQAVAAFFALGLDQPPGGQTTYLFVAS